MMGRRTSAKNYHDVCCKWCRKYLSRKAKSRRDDKLAVTRYERRVEAKANIREQLDYIAEEQEAAELEAYLEMPNGPQWAWDIINSSP